jgi:hypothetical protein
MEPRRPDFPLETRSVQFEEMERKFEFLVIDKAEKWEEAEVFQSPCQIRIPGTNQLVQLQLRGLSYQQWDQIERKFPRPRPVDLSKPNQSAQNREELQATFEQREHQMKLNRRCEIFELALGKPIPGGSKEEKIAWLNQMGSGDMEALFDRIADHQSNMSDGPVLALYLQQAIEKSMEVVEVDSLETWSTLSAAGTFFRMQRPFEDYIIEFPLKQLTEETKRNIATATKDPVPPSKPGRNPVTRQPDPSIPEYNFDDPAYLRAMHSTAQKRLLLHLEAVLPFEIPGLRQEDRFEWIGKRLLGDVVRLRNFIEDELIEYRNRLNFFSNAFALTS